MEPVSLSKRILNKSLHMHICSTFNCNNTTDSQYKQCDACSGFIFHSPSSPEVYNFYSNNNSSAHVELDTDSMQLYNIYIINGNNIRVPGGSVACASIFRTKGGVHTIVLKNDYGIETNLHFDIIKCPPSLEKALAKV